jgi:basic amino acid/polyamine antiporter, APA family
VADANVDAFTRSSEPATGQVQVFTRRASGLVRVMSPYSAFAYNILNIGVIFPWVYITTLAVYPGANVWQGILITGVFTSFLAVVYAGLASAMPRTGGDYVFQSRTLRPWIGFSIVATVIVTFFLQWQALAGWLLATLGLGPLFTGLGITQHNATYLSWGAWFLTGTGAWYTTIVASAIAAAVLIRSFRWFVQAQWVMWYGFLLSFITMVVMFAITPHLTFITDYNRAASIAAGVPVGTTNYYQATLTAAGAAFTGPHVYSIIGTLLVAPVALTSLGWVGYAQEQAGEIQGATSLKNQMFINLGGGVTAMAMMALLAFVMVTTVGQGFLGAAYSTTLAGTNPAPFSPYFSYLAAVLTQNPIILILMIIGIMLNAIQVVFNVIIGWTRVAVAMSIDGALPKVVSSVNPRTHTPVFAHVVFLILGGVVYSYVYNLVSINGTPWTTYTLAVTMVATVMYIGTAMGGALFPRTRPELYKVSPIAKYKVGPIPLITLAGLIATAFSVWMLYWYVTNPFLGVVLAGNPGLISLGIMLAIFLGWVAYYFIRRAYLKSIGINLELAYKEIPPI